MTIRAVVFDIGGVLEITPPTGWVDQWEARLHLNPGELDARLMDVWRAGTLGTISHGEVETRIGQILGMDQQQVAALMTDLWEEYLGELNVELATYFASLRPRYRTALLSNSFAGARDKEQERYHFAELCDLIPMKRGSPNPRDASLNSPVSALASSRQRLSFWTTSRLTSLLPANLACRPSPPFRCACKKEARALS
jgi:hypothetical protein